MKAWLATGVVLAVMLAGCGSDSSGGPSGGTGGAGAEAFRSMTADSATSSGAGAVSGTVRTAGGQPAAGASVTVTAGAGSRQLGDASFSVVTDAQGQFAIGNMPPGTYHCLLLHEGLGAQELELVVLPAQVVSLGMLQLQPRPGQQLGGGSLDLDDDLLDDDDGLITGLVTDLSNQPIAGALVVVDGTHFARTGNTGLFAIGGLDPGTYTVVVVANGFLDGSLAATVLGGQAVLLHFQLTPGSGSPLPQQPATLTGVVIDAATQQPVSGAVVRFGDQAQATTGIDGHFQLSNLQPGVWLLRVQADGYLRYRQPVLLLPGDVVDVVVELVRLPEPNPQVGVLAVTVVDEETGSPIAGALVQVDSYRPVFTDAAGQAVITGVPVGVHNVRAHARRHETEREDVSVLANLTAQLTIELEAQGNGNGPGHGHGNHHDDDEDDD
jgi:hypothetical protein